MGEILTREKETTDSRRRIVSFSSEKPYNRWFGPEILDHGGNGPNLSRLNAVGVVLFNHDPDQVLGKILRAWSENGRGMAEIEFDADPEAEKIFQKVAAGTLKTTSVRYSVEDWEDVKSGNTSTDGRFPGPCRIARKWTPLEISIVSVPADDSVGVGRAETESSQTSNEGGQKNMDPDEITEITETTQTTETPELTESARNAGTPEMTRSNPPITAPNASGPSAAEERQRVQDILALCRQTGMDPDAYIRNGAGMDEVRAAALEHLLQHSPPVRTGGRNRDENPDHFRAAACDAMLMQAGADVENPAPGAEELRGMSVRDLLIETLVRAGEGSPTELLRQSRLSLWDTAVRQFFSPTAEFPAILDDAIRKSIVHQYSLVPYTFERWTSRGSLSDFKTTKEHEYALGGGDFYKVSEGGELKHSTLQTELLPTRRLDTYGTQFTMTREAFINDDIGFLASMPAQYVRVAKRKINRQVYELLFQNGNIFDGKPLFDTAHKNLVSTGSAPSIKVLEQMILQMGMQTDQFGESIQVEPASIIVPVGYGMRLAQLLGTAEIDVDGIGNHTINVLNSQYRSKIQIIEEGTLNLLAGTNACPWFMAADPRLVKGVQVDYLNGVAAPSFRRSEKAGYLGFLWDIWLDWGVNVTDFRGLLRNNGVKLNA